MVRESTSKINKQKTYKIDGYPYVLATFHFDLKVYILIVQSWMREKERLTRK